MDTEKIDNKQDKEEGETLDVSHKSMKILHVDKAKCQSNMATFLPIVGAGIGLGLTAYLMHTGVVNYDRLINFDNIKEITSQLHLPYAKQYLDFMEQGINKVGLNNVIIAGKAIGFAKEVSRPIVENEKFQNNPVVRKIKTIAKGKKNVDKEEEKHPKALLNLVKGGLAIGANAYMIATGQFDYNASYHFDNLPHKLTKVIDTLKNVDMNKVKLAVSSLKLIPNFLKERHYEKKNHLPLVGRFSFKQLIQKTISRYKVPSIMAVGRTEDLIKNGKLPSNIPEISHEGER